MKRVQIEALEFDWIFYGQESENLINRLEETENDDIFLIKSV